MINWPIVILFLLFPIYIVFRLETIARKLDRIEQRQLGWEKRDIKAYNAQVITSTPMKDKDSGDSE